MEWLPVLVVIGVIVLVLGGKKFAPKIVGKSTELAEKSAEQAKEGVNAWSNEISKAFTKEKNDGEVNGEEAKWAKGMEGSIRR